MSPNDNPNLAIPANQKLKTPLKASVVILTSVILAACGTSGKSQSYNLSDITPIVGDGISKDTYEEEKKKAEDAKKEAEEALDEALKAKEEAEKAKEEALKAKEEAEKAKEEAEQALEDALAGGGNKAELEKIAEEKAKEAETAQKVAEEKAKQAQEALEAAEIKNAPESTKTGVQHINIDASGLDQGKLTTTTRDFKVTDKTQVDARADIASGGLVSDPVALKVSGNSDAEVEGSNGFKSFSNTTKVVTSSLGEQDLIYTSTYKDYGDDLRVAHIDGKAAGLLPVNGVAAVGNATKADNVPTEGKVGYTGDATYRKAGDNPIEYGKSVFNVDFVAKNLTGDLTFSDKKIGLQAAIDGNKFSGSKDGYNADGGFYGGDAQYLGGVYEGNDAQGTYGAKSDKQAAADKAAADAKAAADNAKAAAEKAKQEAERAKKRAENAGSGDDQALAEAEARADAAVEAAKAAEEAKLAAEKALKAAEEAANKAVGDAKAEADKRVEEAKNDLADAESKQEQLQSDLNKANEEIEDLKKQLEDAKNNNPGTEPDPVEPNEPESAKSGVQSLNINAGSLGVFNKTTREFSVSEDGSVIEARADLASQNPETPDQPGLLPKVDITTSAEGDTELDNGFKEHKDNAEITVAALDQTLPLAYTSTYKDFGDDMRIGHIHGGAEVALLGTTLPVDGVAVVGNATKAENMPTEGTVGYTGDATYRELGLDKAIEFGSSVFTADFVAKEVKGDLEFAEAGKIGLTADIDGNKFSGAADANGGYATEGGFYGGDAQYLGGVYEGNGAQGTYGAVQDEAPAEPADSEMTGFQSTAMSSLAANSVPLKEFEDAIGYVGIRDDASDFTETETITSADGVESEVPVDNREGDNFTSFDELLVRGDMVQPASVKAPIKVDITGSTGSVEVDAGLGALNLNPDFNYKAVYERFENQMQVGHVYGVLQSSVAGDAARIANVFVQGHLTDQADIDYLKQVNDGKASYAGQATYIENIHLGDEGSFEPVVNGSSNFDVDFVNNSVKGELAFDGDFKYMPEGNKIGIEATIDGNTFTGNVNGIDTAGGFYGEDAKFLGGIYQDASVEGGKGKLPGEGTKFQGTFGAEMQLPE